MTVYQGLSAGIVRQIFYASSRFGLFEVLRDNLAQYRQTDIWSRLAVGMASGAMAAYISCPAEVSLVRMSNDRSLPPVERRNYTSVLNAGARIAREEGLSAFWRGSMPFVNRSMLVGAMQVGTYDQFRQMYTAYGVPKGFPEVFCAAMTSGLLYSIITNPLETAKNRMAFQRPDKAGNLTYRVGDSPAGAGNVSDGTSLSAHSILFFCSFFPLSLITVDHTDAATHYIDRRPTGAVERVSSILWTLRWTHRVHVRFLGGEACSPDASVS